MKEAKRVLKTNGLLYLAIENRYYLKYLFGKPAHHDIPFTTVLPRKISDIITKLLRGSTYRTYIHGLNTYKKLLNESGFKKIKFYTAIPNYVYPEFIVDLDNKKNIIEAISKSSLSRYNKISGIFLANLDLYKYLGPNFVIIAR